MFFKNFFKRKKINQDNYYLERPAQTEDRLRSYIRSVFMDFDVLDFYMSAMLLSQKIYSNYNMTGHISIMLQEKFNLETAYSLDADGRRLYNVVKYTYPEWNIDANDKLAITITKALGRPYHFKAEQFLTDYEINIIKARQNVQ